MRAPDTNGGDTNRDSPGRGDPAVLALSALGWTLADPARADRLLALTGLDAAELRTRAAEPALLAAVLGFLAAHERDLIACADAIGTAPETLVAAQAALEDAS